MIKISGLPVFPFLTLLLIGLWLSIAPAYAHKVNLFAYAEDNNVVVEGFFTDGKVAEKARVEVFSPGGELLVEGEADDDGIFVFEIPEVTDLRISLYAGMGHRVEFTLPADELRSAIAAVDVPNVGIPAQVEAAAAIDSAAIEAIVRQAVSEATLPLVRNLSELNDRRTASDIIGGVGFIVGIIGVFFYLKARSTQARSTPS
jgi:nickel transport protein